MRFHSTEVVALSTRAICTWMTMSISWCGCGLARLGQSESCMLGSIVTFLQVLLIHNPDAQLPRLKISCAVSQNPIVFLSCCMSCCQEGLALNESVCYQSTCTFCCLLLCSVCSKFKVIFMSKSSVHMTASSTSITMRLGCCQPCSHALHWLMLLLCRHHHLCNRQQPIQHL